MGLMVQIDSCLQTDLRAQYRRATYPRLVHRIRCAFIEVLLVLN